MTQRTEHTAAAIRAVPAWRPAYHVTGERNWINDPNGPIHWEGAYHLFFQANPDAPFWGPPRWGHVSSADLVTWHRHPLALQPSPAGPDADGCWSGCVHDIAGRPAAYYTGVTGDNDDTRVETVCRAWGSPELTDWTKDPDNPLIVGPPRERTSGFHRDPFIWQDADGYTMLLGSGTVEGERHGQVLHYWSPEGTSWEYRGVFFEAPSQLAGLNLGQHWECPQLVFGDRHVGLIVSCQDPTAEHPLMHTVCFVGDIQGGRFDGHLQGLIDHGDVFYAPAIATDAVGRTLMWGWAQERITPEIQKTMTHVGALSLPRVATLQDGRLQMRPAPELKHLRGTDLLADHPVIHDAPVHCELHLRVTAATGTTGWRIIDDDAEAEILIDHATRRLQVHITDVVAPSRLLTVPLTVTEETILRVFRDGSLLEVCADDAPLLTTRFYPPDAVTRTIEALDSPSTRVINRHAWQLRSDTILDR